ncbi:hypothetical protein PCH_Pc20g02540 [Penicillium rubens Wisconsin 54-1255]|uniref:Uncharacterized protein n=1 Tax=Penicillium rubens (strain ATCC 28089 / DSM 1075 / NRRL 1951 / Wisconsin 54-1255) TaxID=500485 RepID=B6HEH0_PENRW|nr:hypothetical protein PCH_Pc20g02540 [Penicillium rubens Wisconsin 54-1255]
MWQWGEAVRPFKVLAEYLDLGVVAMVKASSLEVDESDDASPISRFRAMLSSPQYVVNNAPHGSTFRVERSISKYPTMKVTHTRIFPFAECARPFLVYAKPFKSGACRESFTSRGVSIDVCELRGNGVPALVSSWRWILMSPFVSARAGMASWIRLWLRIYNLIYRVWKRSIQQASGAHACYRFWGRHLMWALKGSPFLGGSKT